jgi:general stress protein 26
MSSPEHKNLIWNLIKDIKVGMFVTNELKNEGLRARPMSLVQDAYDGTLFFFTSKSQSKVYEIEVERNVCITFSNPGENTFVSLTGKARMSDNQDLIDQYWNADVAVWFKNGKDDPEVALLEVKISRGEHWDSKSNKLVQLFEIAKSRVFESSTPNIGENEEFGT